MWLWYHIRVSYDNKARVYKVDRRLWMFWKQSVYNQYDRIPILCNRINWELDELEIIIIILFDELKIGQYLHYFFEFMTVRKFKFIAFKLFK